MFSINKIYDTVIRWPAIRKLYYYRMDWAAARHNRHTLDLVYEIDDLNYAYYQKVREVGSVELEHQIGRLMNMKEIIKNCIPLKGDFIEFGTWRGFSLLWIAYFLQRNALFDRKLVGLDGFSGLPHDDGVFRKGTFSNVTLKMCRRNVLDNKILYPEIRKNIFVDRFSFSEKEKIIVYLRHNNISKFCFMHIDCDIYQSVIEIFDILKEGDLIADRACILFDDYGWQSKLAPTVDDIFERMRDNWEISTHSYTRYTKNFLLAKK